MRVLISTALLGLLPALLLVLPANAALPKPTAYVTKKFEGWTVHIDSRLREPPNADLGARAENLLRAKLAEIAAAIPEDRVQKLREVPIWLDLNHGDLTSMQYHPAAEWLERHGYSANLAKAVHIPAAARFAAARHQQVQPWSLLHELSHAYHDQVLGFEEPRIVLAWKSFVASGHGAKALHVNGRRVDHYALTNAKEFFAEMTEAYFGTNDFFPFVNGELLTAEPKIHALLREIWGAAPVEKD